MLLVLLLASAYGAGALALSGTDPLLFADLNHADFEFRYVPQANSDYAIYLFSADGHPVQGRVEVFENGEIIGAASETMISGNLAAMLNSLVDISSETVADGISVLPYAAFDGITISGK